MSESVPSVPEAGNTKESKKGDSPASWWCFTINNWGETDVSTLKLWESKCKVLVFQSEVGESGTPHLQGVFQLKKKDRFTAIKKTFSTAHLEKCKSSKDAIEYCRKDDTWDKKLRVQHGVDEKLEILENPTGWQAELIEDIKKKPDKRKIQWYIDNEGGKGKTELAIHLYVRYNAIVINGGKGSDILHVTAEMIKQRPNTKVIVFDFPRTLEGKVSYSAIESIKNGFFMSTKYEGGIVHINRPHVIVFANWLPDMTQLSQDRWDIYEI